MRTAIGQARRRRRGAAGRRRAAQSDQTPRRNWAGSPLTADVLPPDAGTRPHGRAAQRRQAVTLLCGSGCAGAHDELVALADALKAPIVHALRGKEFVEYDNPFDVGMTGLIGFASGYDAMMYCDTLLMLGTDFPYRQLLSGAKRKIAQIDHPSGGARQPRAGSSSVWSATSTKTHQRAAAAPRAQDRSAISKRARRTTQARARGSMTWPKAARAASSSIRST